MLGLGVGIDYALFVLARHRQNLDAGLPIPQAIGRANATAGLSVLFAGVTVVVAIAGLQVSGIPMMTMMGWASAVMVAVTMLAAVTLLPALLGVVGRRVNSLRVPFIKPQAGLRPAVEVGPVGGRGRGEARCGSPWSPPWCSVCSQPRCSPCGSAFKDAGNDGPSTTTRKAYDLIADAYGPGVNGPFQVVVETHGSDADAALASVGDALGQEQGIASVGQPVLNEGGDLAIIEVTPTTAPQDEETSELLQRLRNDVLPLAVGDADVEATVTGGTAMSDDVSQRLQQRMLWFLARSDRSVVHRPDAGVPFRAGAAEGSRAERAQRRCGVRRGRRGVPVGMGRRPGRRAREVPIMPLAPMLMFAILFGLSMDYEVFLLSRVREQYLRHLRPAAGDRRGRRLDRAGHHQCGTDHDQRLRRVHPDQ